MKKALILIGLLILALLVDLAVRSFSSFEKDEPPPAVQDLSPKPPTPAQNAENDRPKPSGEATNPADNPGMALPYKTREPKLPEGSPDKVIPHTRLDTDRCRAATVDLLSLDVATDLQNALPPLTTETDPKVTGVWRMFAEEYLTCRAIESKRYDLCDQARRLSPEVPPNVGLDCHSVAKLMLPLRAHYIEHLSRADFARELEEVPETKRAWMLEFFDTMAQQKPDNCRRLADDILTLSLCRMASGPIDHPPDNRHLLESYYMILTLRTGKRSFMTQLKSSTSAAFVRAALGEAGVCRNMTETALNAYCTDLNKP